MSIQHHPNADTLLSYAAGSLPASLAMVVGCHVAECAHCRQEVGKAESLGGQLMTELEPKAVSEQARNDILGRLDAAPVAAPVSKTKATARKTRGPGEMPALLQRLLPVKSLADLKWRNMAPGVAQINIDIDEGKLILLRVGAGKAMPVHSHRGNELTLILQGGYHDELGEFHAGDFADLDGSVQHQPVAFDDEDCICLAALDDRLKFRDLLPRLFQPLTGL